MDSMQKRDRDRKRRQRQQEKDARKKERAEQKRLRRTNPELFIGVPGLDETQEASTNELPPQEPAL